MTAPLSICGPITAEKAGCSAVSVADLQAFEALPVEVQELARRVIEVGDVVSTSLEAVMKAYEQGWEDCSEEWQTSEPFMHSKQAEDAAREILGLPPRERQRGRVA